MRFGPPSSSFIPREGAADPPPLKLFSICLLISASRKALKLMIFGQMICEKRWGRCLASYLGARLGLGADVAGEAGPRRSIVDPVIPLLIQ